MMNHITYKLLGLRKTNHFEIMSLYVKIGIFYGIKYRYTKGDINYGTSGFNKLPNLSISEEHITQIGLATNVSLMNGMLRFTVQNILNYFLVDEI